MKIRKKINKQLMDCIYSLELAKKDALMQKENIIDCNITYYTIILYYILCYITR